MAINSREKGKRMELLVAKAFREHGFSDARRSQQFAGINGDADVVGGPVGYHIECKAVERLNIHEAMEQSKRDARDGEIPVVIHKKNREEILVTMRFEDWIKERVKEREING